MNGPTPQQPAEQLRYAALLNWGTRLGLVVLVLSFAAYMLGLLPPHVALDRLPELWSLPVGQYLEQTRSPVGWGWIALATRGDMAGLFGIALLTGCSVVCLLALVPLYLRRGDKAFALLCVAEVAVIALAASGLLTGGH
ncbi:MAG: hypothetical protein JNJ42_00740 [Burkholderiaceae bacterium]|nr:hypothetical protein [Burkholderiaceae bacterium]